MEVPVSAAHGIDNVNAVLRGYYALFARYRKVADQPLDILPSAHIESMFRKVMAVKEKSQIHAHMGTPYTPDQARTELNEAVKFVGKHPTFSSSAEAFGKPPVYEVVINDQREGETPTFHVTNPPKFNSPLEVAIESDPDFPAGRVDAYDYWVADAVPDADGTGWVVKAKRKKHKSYTQIERFILIARNHDSMAWVRFDASQPPPPTAQAEAETETPAPPEGGSEDGE